MSGNSSSTKIKQLECTLKMDVVKGAYILYIPYMTYYITSLAMKKNRWAMAALRHVKCLDLATI